MALIGKSVQVVAGSGRVLIVDPHTGEVVADHAVVAPGEASVADEHYGGARPKPRRAIRPRTPAEKAFCGLGPSAEAFLAGAAASGRGGQVDDQRGPGWAGLLGAGPGGQDRADVGAAPTPERCRPFQRGKEHQVAVGGG